MILGRVRLGLMDYEDKRYHSKGLSSEKREMSTSGSLSGGLSTEGHAMLKNVLKSASVSHLLLLLRNKPTPIFRNTDSKTGRKNKL